MVGILWDSVVWSLRSTCLDVLGLPFLPFVLSLLLYLGFTCCWFLCWWVLSSSVFTRVHSAHFILYVNSGRMKENVLRQQESILLDLKYQQVENRGDPLEKDCDNHDISPN